MKKNSIPTYSIAVKELQATLETCMFLEKIASSSKLEKYFSNFYESRATGVQDLNFFLHQRHPRLQLC